MDQENYTIILKWGDTAIEIPVTEEQQREFIRMAMNVVHGDIHDDSNPFLNSLDFLNEEEEHLRGLLLQFHQNRRILEQKEAEFGNAALPLHIANELKNTMKQINEINSKINNITRRRKLLTS